MQIPKEIQEKEQVLKNCQEIRQLLASSVPCNSYNDAIKLHPLIAMMEGMAKSLDAEINQEISKLREEADKTNPTPAA